MAIETKQLHALSKIYNEAVYGKSPEQIEASRRKKNDLAGAPLTVTNADKKANTKAYQNYKAGVKGYKAADHMKEGDQYSGTGEKVAARTKKYMDKKGQKGAPGLDAMKARTAEHQAKRGVKSESMQHRRNPEGSIKDRFKSTQTDPSKDNFTGIGDSIKDIMKQNAAMKKAAAKKTKKESLSNWRQDLKEIPDYEEIPASAKKRNEKIEEKDNIKNEIKINPEMKEDTQVVSETEMSEAEMRKYKYDDKFYKEIKKDDKETKKITPTKMARKGVSEGVYEKQKTKEVMGALKKRDLKTDVKKKIAADIVKKKGDTSKSDDRYAYESKLWDEVAANLTELGELNDADFRVEGYQRDPEGGEEKERKAKRERKGGYDEKRARRMNDPKKGINSPAFQEFMRSRGM